MNDFDQSFHEFQAAQHARRSAEEWLAAFETALASQDAATIATLFHPDSHWRDILVVNRALVPAHLNIVVAQVDGDFTVKYLHKRHGRVKLVPANPTFPEITFKEGQQLIITGVVVFAIKHFLK